MAKKKQDDGGLKAAVEKLKIADKGKKVTHTRDSQCSSSSAVVRYFHYILKGESEVGISGNFTCTCIFMLLPLQIYYPIWTKLSIFCDFC